MTRSGFHRIPWYESHYTGLFSNLALIPPEPSDPDLFLYGGEIPSHHFRPQRLILGGAGFSKEAAKGACVGEAIERFACYPIPSDEVITVSYQKWPLTDPAVRPMDWVLFHAEQYQQMGFPFMPLRDDTVCDWVCFRTACEGRAVWVPREFAYLYPPQGRSHQFSPAVSTGLACGRKSDPVLLRGLQEVIERDALMGAFWGNYLVEEIPSEWFLTRLHPTKVRRILRSHLRYRFYRLCSPFSNNVCVVTITGETRVGFCLSIGTACRETRLEGFEKALVEAIQGWHYVRYLKSEIEQKRRPFSGDCHDFADHAVYYSLFPSAWQNTVFAHPPFSTGLDLETHPESLAMLQNRLGKSRPILFRNVTPPEVVQRRTSDYVLKVLVPGLQPMHGNDQFPHLGGPLWGQRGIADFAKISPHPFP